MKREHNGNRHTGSMYQPAWDSLKSCGKVVVTANPKLHARIKKAIIKRKDLDIAYKLQVAEENKRAVLTFAVVPAEPNDLIVTLAKVTGWRHL